MSSEFYTKERFNEKRAKKLIEAAKIYFTLDLNDTVEAILGKTSVFSAIRFTFVTTKEVIYFGGILDKRRIPFSSITGVDVESGVFAKIELAIGGAKTEVLDTYSMMDDAILMRDFILSKINKQATTNNEISASDEISKFYDLKEKGIITQEEFESKKKQLLNL